MPYVMPPLPTFFLSKQGYWFLPQIHGLQTAVKTKPLHI